MPMTQKGDGSSGRRNLHSLRAQTAWCPGAQGAGTCVGTALFQELHLPNGLTQPSAAVRFWPHLELRFSLLTPVQQLGGHVADRSDCGNS